MICTGEPVLPFRHGDLEPGTFARSAGLGDRHTGKNKALPDKKQSKADLFIDEPVKKAGFDRRGDSDAVIFADKNKPIRGFLAGKGDACYGLSMFYCIINEF